jgi:hypothetical protein
VPFGTHHLLLCSYKPNSSRGANSISRPGLRTEGEIHAAFGQRLDLFSRHPRFVLARKSPYEAIQDIVNGRAILSVGNQYDKYLEWAEKYFPPLRGGREVPELLQIRRIEKFLRPCDCPPEKFHPRPLGG